MSEKKEVENNSSESSSTDSSPSASKREPAPTPAPAGNKAKATQKSTPPSKPEIPDQPLPPLPTGATENSPAVPPKPTEGGADAATPQSTPAPETPAPSAAATPSPNEADTPAAKGKSRGGVSVAPNVSISPEDLLGFADQPARVQTLIRAALDLARQKLTYTYGSADPSNGGMDCSGAIQYLLSAQGFKDVPRDASGQYVWARKHGQFFAVVSKKADSFEFGDLLPGDLLFWNGTYNIQRDPPVTHTMIYLGVQRLRAQHVMWGSSDGRTYDSKPRWGVSVFDFKMPRVDRNVLQPAKADFIGYARIPGLRE